jgi:hypothetical protein
MAAPAVDGVGNKENSGGRIGKSSGRGSSEY